MNERDREIDAIRAARLARREKVRRRTARQRKLVAGSVGLLLLALVLLLVSSRFGDGLQQAGAQGAPDERAQRAMGHGNFTIAAVGDTMLGNTPQLPPSPLKYFSAVQKQLSSGAQIVFGNLEGTLTDAEGSKCGSESTNCYAFRTPPSFARAYRAAGFTLLNNANNHSYDFGETGQVQTVRSIRRARLKQTGLEGQITFVDAGSVRVAILGFGPYKHMSSLLDLPVAQAQIQRASSQADVVLVYMHAGSEGAEAQHVTGDAEEFHGEPRGNPRGFAHMAIDAGAALVIASGPHVLRGLEFYKHRLIAYSLGNFAGFNNFATGGVMSNSCILRATLTADGRLRSARIVSVMLDAVGRPQLGGDAIPMMARLSREDFGSDRARVHSSGRISEP